MAEPCIGCGRLYGHLEGCTVVWLHDALDQRIKEYGLQKIGIVVRGSVVDNYYWPPVKKETT